VARHRDLDRRLELLDAVVHHLGQRGVSGVSVRGLARDLGLNPNALAHHFGGRVELLRAALDRALQIQLAVQDRQEQRRPHRSEAERIRSWWRWTTSSPDHLATVRIAVEVATLPPGQFPVRPDGVRFAWQVGMRERLRIRGLDRRTAESEFARMTAIATGLVVEMAVPGSRRRLSEVLESTVIDLEARLAAAEAAAAARPGRSDLWPASPDDAGISNNVGRHAAG